jgi:hypothetical protein
MLDLVGLSHSLTTINPAYGLGGPSVLMGALLTFLGWKDRKVKKKIAAHVRLEQERREHARQAELARRTIILQTAAVLRSEDETWRRAEGAGQLPLAFVGTASASQAPHILKAFVRAGAAGYIANPILLAEPDHMSKTQCLMDLPSAFRVAGLTLRLLPAGLTGRTVSEGAALQPYWLEDLNDLLELWLMRLRRQAMPVTLFLPLSPGGSSCLAGPIIRRFKEENPQADVVVLLYLDHKTPRREINIPELLDLYGQSDLIKGFIIVDNRRQSELFDHAISLLLPSLVTSSWIDTRPQSGFNVLADLFRHHRVATLRAAVAYLPVHHLPAIEELDIPEVYYTDLSFAQSQGISTLTRVLTDHSLQALPLRPSLIPQFAYTIAPIRPDPDYIRLAERIRRTPLPNRTHDTTLAFSSIGTALHPGVEEVPLTTVSLHPVVGGVEAVKRYLKGQLVYPDHEPTPEAPLPEHTTIASRNGQSSPTL